MRYRLASRRLKIAYGAPDHSIDANVLMTSVLNITETLQEINRVNGEDYKLNVRINALGAGSFEVFMDLITDDLLQKAKSLFSVRKT